MAETVYALCFLTSVVCAILLFRGYRASGTKLLLWSGVCFGGLALNNLILFVDLIVVPEVDLSVLRGGIALASMMTLIIGLVWESR